MKGQLHRQFPVSSNRPCAAPLIWDKHNTTVSGSRPTRTRHVAAVFPVLLYTTCTVWTKLCLSQTFPPVMKTSLKSYSPSLQGWPPLIWGRQPYPCTFSRMKWRLQRGNTSPPRLYTISHRRELSIQTLMYVEITLVYIKASSLFSCYSFLLSIFFLSCHFLQITSDIKPAHFFLS